MRHVNRTIPRDSLSQVKRGGSHADREAIWIAPKPIHGRTELFLVAGWDQFNAFEIHTIKSFEDLQNQQKVSAFGNGVY